MKATEAYFKTFKLTLAEEFDHMVNPRQASHSNQKKWCPYIVCMQESNAEP